MQEVKRETTFCGKVAEKTKIFFCLRTDNKKVQKLQKLTGTLQGTI